MNAEQDCESVACIQSIEQSAGGGISFERRD